MKYEDFLDNVLADSDVMDALDEGGIAALDEALYMFQNKSSTQKELDFYTHLYHAYIALLCTILEGKNPDSYRNLLDDATYLILANLKGLDKVELNGKPDLRRGPLCLNNASVDINRCGISWRPASIHYVNIEGNNTDSVEFPEYMIYGEDTIRHIFAPDLTVEISSLYEMKGAISNSIPVKTLILNNADSLESSYVLSPTALKRIYLGAPVFTPTAGGKCYPDFRFLDDRMWLKLFDSSGSREIFLPKIPGIQLPIDWKRFNNLTIYKAKGQQIFIRPSMREWAQQHIKSI